MPPLHKKDDSLKDLDIIRHGWGYRAGFEGPFFIFVPLSSPYKSINNCFF